MQIDCGTEWAPKGMSAEWRDKHVVVVIGLSYGREGGWSDPVVGYEVVVAPRSGSGRMTFAPSAFLAQYEPLLCAPDWRDDTIEMLKRERDNHDRRAAEWQAKVGELQPQVESLTRDLKIAREWNVKHLETIAQRPDAWTWGKCQEERDEARQALVGAQLMRDAMRKERDDLRAALAETDTAWRNALASVRVLGRDAQNERARASKARELEEQVETLKRILAAQVKERQEAQDAFVAAERARKQAEAALAADCYGCANTPAISAELQSLRAQVEASKQERRGKVERQSEEIARLNAEVQYQKSVVAAREADVAFVRKNASAEWRTRAEKAEGERDSLRGEVQRLASAQTCPHDGYFAGVIKELQAALTRAESERDAARAHRRETESHLSEAPPRRMQRKVEAQRVALAALEEKNRSLTEKVAAQWARAERAGYERGQFLAEVQRLTPKIATLETTRSALDALTRATRAAMGPGDWRPAWFDANAHRLIDEVVSAIKAAEAVLK